jgi:phosphocarrier protein HPr
MRMNGTPLQRTVLLANPNGLHMRPSAAFAELAGHFECNVTVSVDGRSANGKSIWDLMALAAMPGSQMILEADGPDAKEALDALAELLSRPPEDN